MVFQLDNPFVFFCENRNGAETKRISYKLRGLCGFKENVWFGFSGSICLSNRVESAEYTILAGSPIIVCVSGNDYPYVVFKSALSVSYPIGDEISHQKLSFYYDKINEGGIFTISLNKFHGKNYSWMMMARECFKNV